MKKKEPTKKSVPTVKKNSLPAMIFFGALGIIILLIARKYLTWGKIREGCYKGARGIGDFTAFTKGRIRQRITNRVAGYATGRLLGKILPR